MAFSMGVLCFFLIVIILHNNPLEMKKLLPPKTMVNAINSNPPFLLSVKLHEAEEKINELQKEIFELKSEVEMQHKRRHEAETRAEIAEKKVENLSSNHNNKWILSIKPKVQYLTDKSTEVLYTFKQVLTPHLIQGLEVIMKTWKVEVALKSCTQILRIVIKKLLSLLRDFVRD